MSNTTTAKKPTQREMYTSLLSNPTLTAEQVEFIKGRIAALDKKNASGERKPTATQIANEALKSAILEAMTPNMLYTVSDMIKQFPACAGLNPQKISPLVNQLYTVRKLDKSESKGRSYFSLPVAEGENATE